MSAIQHRYVTGNDTIIFFATQLKMAILLFIGVLQCLAVLCCCELFVSGRLNIK